MTNVIPIAIEIESVFYKWFIIITMYEDQKVECTSCGETFTPETNATLCSVCPKEVSNMISSSVRGWDHKIVIVTINSFQINRLWPSKDYGSMCPILLKRKKIPMINNGDVRIALV
jgi:hypothetical protein